MKPVIIRYRDGKHKVQKIHADGCTGEIPAYSNTYYWNFTLSGQNVGRIASSRLLPGFVKSAEHLYGRPWLIAIREAPVIHLRLDRDAEGRLGGLPKDYVRVWEVNDDSDTWVIECEGRAILHILNNPEVSRRGKTFEEAVHKLFPKQKVKIYHQIVTVQVTEV